MEDKNKFNIDSEDMGCIGIILALGISISLILLVIGLV